MDCQFLVNGFRQGFHVPFDGEIPTVYPTNLKSCSEHGQVIQDKIKTELRLGRISGPFKDPPLRNFVCSPIGVVPKKTPGDFRLIHHLSFPHGHSINSGIDKQDSTVSYHTVDQAIDIICSLESGSYLSKTDIQSAFRIIPVHPSNYHLLGFHWNGMYYFDKTLAMGLSASCQIFERFSSALQWIAQTWFNIPNMLHILDDFLIISPTQSAGERHLQSFMSMCASIGVPLAPHKTEGPSTVLTFAGIQLDTTRREAAIPHDKLIRYTTMVHDIMRCKRVSLRQLQSVIGCLNHCAYIIPGGRAFLRRLIDLTIGITRPHYHVRFNKEVRKDLAMWYIFLKDFNGKALFLEREWTSSTTLHMYTDSAQSLGYGAIFQDRWLWGAWPEQWTAYDITLLELYPIVVACQVWGKYLRNRRIVLHTDNLALVYILNKYSSKDKRIMVLIRHLTLLSLRHNILFRSEHIPGLDNILPDHLSRLRLQDFRRLSPESRAMPDEVPLHLLPQNWCLD